jgi:hypothetical protein
MMIQLGRKYPRHGTEVGGKEQNGTYSPWIRNRDPCTSSGITVIGVKNGE